MTESAVSMDPINCIEAMGAFLKEKVHEHHQLTLGMEFNPPTDERLREKKLFIFPYEIKEDLLKANKSRSHFTATDKNGKPYEYETLPPFYGQLTLILTCNAESSLHSSILLLKVQQIIQEYGTFKVQDEVVPFKILSSFSMSNLADLWRSLGVPFRPALAMQINLELAPVRRWNIKLVKERIIHTSINEDK